VVDLTPSPLSGPHHVHVSRLVRSDWPLRASPIFIQACENVGTDVPSIKLYGPGFLPGASALRS